MQRDVRKFGISDKRGRVQTSVDPFVSQQGLQEPAICTGCQASYRHKRWLMDADLYEQLVADPNCNRHLCPACQKIAEGYAEGVIMLKGDYLWAHQEEILRLLQNVAQRAREKNPVGRILRQQRKDDTLVIETTERKLAEHLGRALHRAHHGALDISWSQDHDICRVSWERIN